MKSKDIIVIDDSITELLGVFREKRGYDASWLIGPDEVGEMLALETDYYDSRTGEWVPEPGDDYAKNLPLYVANRKRTLFLLITDDQFYDQMRTSCMPGETVRLQGERRANVTNAFHRPEINCN